jgi:hypothetical protein
VLCEAKCTELHFAKLPEVTFSVNIKKRGDKNMGYTVSFDASIKCKKSDLKGLLNHIERGTIDKKINHKNPNINNQKTENNFNFYFDKNQNDFSECTDLSQIENALSDRLKEVKKPLRKDAVIARPLILQLDPEYYKDSEDYEDYEEETERSVAVMLEWACSTFGKENIIGGSVHLDEASPHMHLIFTPVTDDGRLSQKDWFKSPSSLADMHNSLRTHMADNGFNIEMKRKKTSKHVKRLTETEYRDYKEIEEEAQNNKNTKYILDRKENRLNTLQASLDAQKSDLEAREKVLADEIEKYKVKQKECDIKRSEALKAISECKTLSDAMKDKDEWMSKTELAKHVTTRAGKTGFIKVNVLQEYTDSTKVKISQSDINKSISALESKLGIGDTYNKYNGYQYGD